MMISRSSNPYEYSFTQKKLAEVALALGHPARVAIVGILMERGSCTAGDVSLGLPLSPATVSEHMKILFDAGLIGVRENGSTPVYVLEERAMRNFCGAFTRRKSLSKVS